MGWQINLINYTVINILTINNSTLTPIASVLVATIEIKYSKLIPIPPQSSFPYTHIKQVALH